MSQNPESAKDPFIVQRDIWTNVSPEQRAVQQEIDRIKAYLSRTIQSFQGQPRSAMLYPDTYRGPSSGASPLANHVNQGLRRHPGMWLADLS